MKYEIKWENGCSADFMHAETPFGRYVVAQYVGLFGVRYEACRDGVAIRSGFVCPKDAADYAQADVDRRLRMLGEAQA